MTRSRALFYFSGSNGAGNGYIADLNRDGTIHGAPTLVTERFLNANSGAA